MLLGALTSSWPAEKRVGDEKTRKIMEKISDGLLLAAILVRRRQPVASGIALDPLRRSMRWVTYRRTDRASETADKYGTFSYFFNGIWTRCPSGAIRPKYSPNGGVQWLRMKPWTPSSYRAISAVSCRHMNSSVKMGRIGVLLSVADDFAINLTLCY